ncbi:MAG: rod shape-determining protein MreD [Acidimicrobiales bacterium]
MLLSVLLVQVAVVSDLRAFDAVGDLVLLMALAAGSVGGQDRGAVVGFVAGLSYDLMLDTPFGLAALTCVLAGYAAGWATGRVDRTQWWFHVATSAVLSIVAVVFSVIAARVLGLAFALDDLVRTAVVVAAWNGALILPARRLWRWVYDEEVPGRYRVALP